MNRKTGEYDCYNCGDTKGIWRAIAPAAHNGDRLQSKRKSQKSAKAKNRDIQLNAAQIEAKVDELAIMVADEIHTTEEAAVELSIWCKEWGHSEFNAVKLLTAKLEQLSKKSGLTLEDARKRLEALVDEGVAYSDVQMEAIHLAAQTGRQIRDLENLYRAIQQERGRATVDRADFDDLAQATQESYDLSQLLPTLAHPIKQCAQAFNQPAVVFSVPLLAVAGSLLHPETRLAIGGPTDYRLPPIFWGGLVADPGSIKTPILNLVLKPLHLLQQEAYSQYQEDNQAYNRAERDYQKSLKEKKDDGLEEPIPPKLRHYYCDNATVEKIQHVATEQIDKGLVIAPDELSGFFNSFNQYKGGKGSDRDFWKSAADGAAVKVDRVSNETRFAAKTSISVTGSIQHEPLQGLMQGGDSDGFWSRFLWIRLPLRRLPAPGDGLKIDLTNWFYATYQHLERIPAKSFQLSTEARKTWHRWHEWIEDKRLSTDTPVERVLYPKYRDRAGRVALIAHCLEYASQGKEPPETIPNATLEAAISFTTFCLNQTRLLYADIGVSDELTGHLLRAWEWIQEKGLTEFKVSDLQGSRRIKIGHKDYAKADYCRELLEQLVTLGYLTQTGKEFSIIESKIENSFNSQNPEPESDTGNERQKIEKLKGGVFSANIEPQQNGHSPPTEIQPLSARELAASVKGGG
ncbi:MAG: DUF3987 domain-containing protein [Cyanobacteria bacterium P01_H01_bin.153]